VSSLQGEAVATQILENTGEEIEVGRMRVGQYFGERALITNQPRAATVKADGELKVAVMDRASFERLLGPCKDVMKRYMEQYPTAAAVVRSGSMSALKKPRMGDHAAEEVVMGSGDADTTSAVPAVESVAPVAPMESKSEDGPAADSAVAMTSPVAIAESTSDAAVIEAVPTPAVSAPAAADAAEAMDSAPAASDAASSMPAVNDAQIDASPDTAVDAEASDAAVV